MVSENNVRIMITLPKYMVESIDKCRSWKSRSSFVFCVLQEYFGKIG